MLHKWVCTIINLLLQEIIELMKGYKPNQIFTHVLWKAMINYLAFICCFFSQLEQTSNSKGLIIHFDFLFCTLLSLKGIVLYLIPINVMKITKILNSMFMCVCPLPHCPWLDVLFRFNQRPCNICNVFLPIERNP